MCWRQICKSNQSSFYNLIQAKDFYQCLKKGLLDSGIKLTIDQQQQNITQGIWVTKRLRKYVFLIQVVHGSMKWPMGWNKTPRIKSRVPGQPVCFSLQQVSETGSKPVKMEKIRVQVIKRRKVVPCLLEALSLGQQITGLGC